MEPNDFLEKIYKESMQIVGSDDTIKSDLNKNNCLSALHM